MSVRRANSGGDRERTRTPSHQVDRSAANALHVHAGFGTGEWGDFLVRTYPGRQQSEAIATFVKDADTLAQRGYAPVSQSWGDGQWDGAYFVLALVLSLFGIGLILLAYMAIIRPSGTLCVMYRLR